MPIKPGRPARLSMEDAQKIFDLAKLGLPRPVLAKRYDIGEGSIRSIVEGKTFPGIDRRPKPPAGLEVV